MEDKIIGAWLVHHAQKIQATTNQDFENILFAGKAAILLSALSADTQDVLSNDKVNSLAKANHISYRTELPVLLEELKRQRLIDIGENGIEVIGLGGTAVMSHAAQIFKEGDPSNHETAALEVADLLSQKPQREADFLEEIGDKYSLTKHDAKDFLSTSTYIGFFDTEEISKTEKIFFNGNLFRKDGIRKVSNVLDSMPQEERACLQQLQAELQEHGCIPLDVVLHMMPEPVLRKIQSIGLVDVSSVGNDLGQHHFVTSPAAFSKFTNSLADDALDLAKLLVASLTYGMTKSSSGRGRITQLRALMNRLISGSYVGPATAIGQDYRVLEYKRVIEVRKDGSRFSMRLLKPEVGKLALAVLEEGGVMPLGVQALPGASISAFAGPEKNRAETRVKQQAPGLKKGIANLLDDLRTGSY